MYIDANTIIMAASFLGAVSALVGAVIAVYKVIESNKESNKKQNEAINAMQAEQTIIPNLDPSSKTFAS